MSNPHIGILHYTAPPVVGGVEAVMQAQAEADLIAFETHAQESPIVRDCYMLSGEIDFLLRSLRPQPEVRP